MAEGLEGVLPKMFLVGSLDQGKEAILIMQSWVWKTLNTVVAGSFMPCFSSSVLCLVLQMPTYDSP